MSQATVKIQAHPTCPRFKDGQNSHDADGRGFCLFFSRLYDFKNMSCKPRRVLNCRGAHPRVLGPAPAAPRLRGGGGVRDIVSSSSLCQMRSERENADLVPGLSRAQGITSCIYVRTDRRPGPLSFQSPPPVGTMTRNRFCRLPAEHTSEGTDARPRG